MNDQSPTQRFNDQILNFKSKLTKEELQVLLRVRLNFIEFCHSRNIDIRFDIGETDSVMFKDYLRDQIDFHEALEMYEVCAILKTIGDKLMLNPDE